MPDQGDSGFPKLSANAITAHLGATFAGLPVYVHTMAHADGVVLVDTGMIDSTPELDEEGAPAQAGGSASGRPDAHIAKRLEPSTWRSASL